MSHSFKIVLLGEGRVGKTSLMVRYIHDKFDDNQRSTVQATNLQKIFKLQDKKIILSVWDTAGQEKFHSLGSLYYRNAHGAVLVYDVTDMDSFTRVQNWVKELRKVVGPDIILTLAGNKCDLKGKQVSEEEAVTYAKSVGATHIYTSAKANKNVNEAFLETTKRILEKSISKQSALSTVSNDDSFVTSSRKSVSVVNDSNSNTPSSNVEGKKCC